MAEKDVQLHIIDFHLFPGLKYCNFSPNHLIYRVGQNRSQFRLGENKSSSTIISYCENTVGKSYIIISVKHRLNIKTCVVKTIPF